MKINGTLQLYSQAYVEQDPYVRGINALLYDVFNPRIYGVYNHEDDTLIEKFDDKDAAYKHRRKMLIQGLSTYVKRVK